MTLRQQKLIKNLGNSRTIQEAMIKSEYAPSTAHQQTSITKSKGFEELLEEHLPDDKIMIAHEEGLGAMKQIGAQILIDTGGNVISKENEGMIEVADHAIRLKAAELAYKVKGRLKEGINVQGDLNMTVNIVRHAGS